MKVYTIFWKRDTYHVALCKKQTKHDRIRDGNIEICILHKMSKILVYKTSSHQIFYHILPISLTYKSEYISGIKGIAHFEKGRDRISSATHLEFNKNTHTGHSAAKYLVEFLRISSCKNDSTGNSLQRNRIIWTYNRQLKCYPAWEPIQAIPAKIVIT